MTREAEIERMFRLWDSLEDAQYRRREGETSSHVIDRLLVKPWESSDERVRQAWRILTDPSNLSGLEVWAEGIEGFNPTAREYTEAALRECLQRAASR